MGTISKDYTFSNGTTADATEVNANFDTIINEINGSLDDNNVDFTSTSVKNAILTNLKTVDGDGSGLDAELVKGKDIDTDGDGVVNEADKATNVVSIGLHADRPAAGTAGRIYVSTDKGTDGVTFYDTGSAWKPMNGYSVGDIHMTTNSTNPATALGYGTWAEWGKGRVPVGVDTSDTDFDTVEETGGEKEHTLTIDEMPAHTHDYYSHYSIYDKRSSKGEPGNSNDDTIQNTTTSAGGDSAHNNLQPYIVVYMWKRTA